MLYYKIKRLLEDLYIKDKLIMKTIMDGKEYNVKLDYENTIKGDIVILKIPSYSKDTINIKEIIYIKKDGTIGMRPFKSLKETFIVLNLELSIYEINQVNLLEYIDLKEKAHV